MLQMLCCEGLGDEIVPCDQIYYTACNVTCGTGEQKAITEIGNSTMGTMETTHVVTATCNTVPCEGMRVVIHMIKLKKKPILRQWF